MDDLARMNGSDAPKRDAFSAAKDTFLLSVSCNKALGEAAVKIAVFLTVKFANRAEFEKSGNLVAWPSKRKLSAETNLFRSRVDRAIISLEGAGLLKVIRPENGKSTHHNRYVLCTSNGRTDAANTERQNGRTTVTNSNGRTDATTLAAPVGPNSSDSPLDGVGARPRARPTTKASGQFAGSNDKVATGGLVAPVRDPPPSPPSIAPTESASEQYDDLAREWAEADRFRDPPGDEGDPGGDLEPNILEDNDPISGEDDATACDRYAGYRSAFSDLRGVLRDLGVASSDLNLWANSVLNAVLYDDSPTGAADRVAELVAERPWLAVDLANTLARILPLVDPGNAFEAMDCAFDALFDGVDPRIKTTQEVRRG